MSTLLYLLACSEPDKGAATLSVSAEDLDFGAVPVGTESPLSFVIANDGGEDLSLLSVSLIEGASSIFALDRDEGDVVAGGDELEVRVTFSPEEEDSYLGRIQIRTDLSEGTAYVALSGEGSPSTADRDSDGYSEADGDCDDGNADVHPGATEICDGRDDDCNGSVPSDEDDLDHDGWLVCEGDCDDADSAVHPEADEICDGKDSDCDGVTADDEDRDGDGLTVCDGDCDDDSASSYPGAPELCDGLDNDCSGEPDDEDKDGDGFTPCQADCDDNDASAYPSYVDGNATGAGAGTPDDPWHTIADGLANVDASCHTVYVTEGRYEEALTWSGGLVTIQGDTLGDVVIDPPEGSRGLTIDGGTVTVDHVVFSGGDPSADGGAIFVDGATLTLSSSRVEDNTCTGDGGGIAVSSGVLTVSDTSFTGNVADDDGGAISVLSSTIDLDGMSVDGNQAVRGGGMQLDSATGWITGSSVTGNTAVDQGGGVELIGGSSLVVQANDVWLNTAGGAGGGLSVVDVADDGVWLRNLVIASNSAASTGGGIAYGGSVASGLCANNTLVANDAAAAGGIEVDVADASALWVWSNVLSNNDGATGLSASGSGASVAWNLLYATTSGTDLDVGGEDQGDNVVDNPRFTSFSNNGDPTDDDLSLNAASPGLHSGPTSGGPAGYDWSNPDGSRNNRGYTGGPGAE